MVQAVCLGYFRALLNDRLSWRVVRSEGEKRILKKDILDYELGLLQGTQVKIANPFYLICWLYCAFLYVNL